MESQFKKIVENIAKITQQEKHIPSFMHITSSANNDISLPQNKFPYIYIVLNGKLSLNTSEGIVQYNPGEYFVSSIITPLKGNFSGVPLPDDFLAVSVSFLPDEIISVMLELDKNSLDKIFTESQVENNDLKIMDIVRELLNINIELRNSIFLLNHFKKELIFYIITGKYGKDFIRNTFKAKDAGNIYRINSWIKENYKSVFSVEDLAAQANMSVSAFHQKFKNIIGMGPIQCQKKLRLIEARNLMLRKGISVTSASLEVGYESLSQFNRDYKHLFGESPKKDIHNIQSHLK